MSMATVLHGSKVDVDNRGRVGGIVDDAEASEMLVLLGRARKVESICVFGRQLPQVWFDLAWMRGGNGGHWR